MFASDMPPGRMGSRLRSAWKEEDQLTELVKMLTPSGLYESDDDKEDMTDKGNV